MSKLIIGSLVVIAVSSLGCSGGGDDDTSAGSASITQAHKRGGGNEGGNEITVLARDLIMNGTADNTLATTTEDKGLIDVNRIRFGALFFR